MNDHDMAGGAIPPEKGGDAADELAYRLRQQELIARFGRFALGDRNFDALLQEATRLCAEGMQSELCKVMEYLPDEGEFIVRAGVGWRPGIIGIAHAGADTGSPAGYAFHTGHPVISNHLAAESRFRTPQILAEHGVKRAINVLIQGDGDRFGILEVDSPDEGRFTEHDLAFMQAVANLLGLAIERRRTEQALRDSEALLARTLAHQEVLTREISHRVKNSLTIVGSLLAMQARMSGNPDVERALADAQSRVRTIAQVHDRLWRADEVQMVDLADFMGELCEQLRATASAGQVLTCDFAPVTIATDQAVPMGLLINELVTNAFKYAYPDGEGEVRISVTREDAEHLEMTVCDSGIGLPPDLGRGHGKSLGMKLIDSLGRQLGGKPEWRDAGPGTCFSLTFFARGE